MLSIKIDRARIIFGRVDVEEQHVSGAELLEFVRPDFPDHESRNPGHLAEPESLLLDESR